MTTVARLLLVALLAAVGPAHAATGQGVGKLGPTSNLSSATVLSPGGGTARTLAEWMGHLTGVEPLSSATVTATGGTTARSLAEHLATLPDARITASDGTVARALADLAQYVEQSRIQHRTGGGRVIDFTALPAPAAAGTAAGPSITLDAARGHKFTWTSATTGQYVSGQYSGAWNFSSSDVFGVDVDWDGAEEQALLYLLFTSDAGALSNYAVTGTLLAATKKYRGIVPILKSALTVTGAPDWSAIKHVHVRLYRNLGAGASTMYVRGLWSHLAAPTKVLLSFDDPPTALYSGVFPIMRAQQMKGTAYVAGGLVGLPNQSTLAELKEMYSAGWDVASHGYSHMYMSWGPTSYTRSGTTATYVLPAAIAHGYSVGEQVTIVGADEAPFNGTFTVTAVPNAYTLQFAVPDTSLNTTAYGAPYIVGKPTPAQIEADINSNAAWLATNGFVRGARHLAYPYGRWDPALEAQVRDSLGIRTGRAAGRGMTNYIWNTIEGLRAPHRIAAMDLNETMTAATALAEVDAAISKASSLVFVGHGIATPAVTNHMATAEFQTFIDGLAARRTAGTIEVVTISQWYAQMGGAAE